MATLVYRCPATGLNVQGRFSDGLSDGGGDVYEIALTISLINAVAISAMNALQPISAKICDQDIICSKARNRPRPSASCCKSAAGLASQRNRLPEWSRNASAICT
jgi:hypothetical protein